MSAANVSAANAPIRRALFSVSDKSGLVEFATFLSQHKVELISTGGSAAALRKAGLYVKEVADVIGFPEMLDGRVKTLHPKIHGGLLGIRGNAAHEKAMADHGIAPIDLLVVNLYPFEATVASGADFETCIENIDIGGPAMIRAAAKNHDGVAVVVDPADYAAVIDEMKATKGSVSADLRRRLAARAYARTANYDTAISTWFAGELKDDYPRWFSFGGTLKQTLRYGENPHQSAALYVTGQKRPGVATATQIQGKELSYNNINDTDAAYELAAEFDTPACAIIKHANPCGVALGATCLEAYEKALVCDPVSAFGGIIALNRAIDGPTAKDWAKIVPAVLDHLGIEKAHIGGHHTGGAVAIAAASLFPERTSSLIIHAALLVTEEERAKRLERVTTGERGFVYKEDGSHLTDTYRGRYKLYGEGADPKLITRYVIERFLGTGESWYGHHVAYEYNSTEGLKNMKARTLVLGNSGDMVIEITRRIKTLRPDVAYVELEGGGVDIVDQQPQVWVDAIHRFINA